MGGIQVYFGFFEFFLDFFHPSVDHLLPYFEGVSGQFIMPL